jgi:hypothetical protein
VPNLGLPGLVAVGREFCVAEVAHGESLGAYQGVAGSDVADPAYTRRVAWRAFAAIGLTLAVGWIALLSRYVTSFPTRDDINYFLWIARDIELNGILGSKWFFHAHGPHLDYAQKIFGWLALETTDYDSRLFSLGGPLAAVLLAVPFFLCLRTDPNRPKPSGRRAALAGWTIAAAAVLLMVLSPIRADTFEYDMLSLTGHLMLAASAGMAFAFDRFAIAGRHVVVFAVLALLSVFFFASGQVIPFVAACIVAGAVIVAGNALVRAWRSAGFSSAEAVRVATASAFLGALWFAFDRIGNWASDAAVLTESLPAAVWHALGLGLHQSLGGNSMRDLETLVGGAGPLRALLLMVALAVLALNLPYLVRTRRYFILAILLQPPLAAIGSYVLRGGIQATRYQGFLSLFWVALLCLVFVRIWDRDDRARHPVTHRAGLTTAAVLLGFAVLAHISVGIGYVRTFEARIARGEETTRIFLTVPRVTDEDAAILHCANLDICQKAVDFIRARRHIGPPPAEAARPGA